MASEPRLRRRSTTRRGEAAGSALPRPLESAIVDPIDDDFAAPDQALGEEAAVLRGYLDRIAADEISGWAWLAARPDERVSLDILFNGSVIATVTADQYRADLLSTGIGDGRHAFRWTPLPSLFPEGPCTVSVVREGTDQLLAPPRMLGLPEVFASAAQDTNYVGNITQAEPYRISGWVWCPDRPTERVAVDVLLNGVTLATVRCDAFSQELEDSGVGDGRHSFAWIPDTSLLVPGSYTVEVRIAVSGDEFTAPRPMLYRPAMLIDGTVSIGADTTVEGWVWNKMRRDEAVSVGLFEGDNLLVTAVADEYDARLLSDGVGNGMHAFRLRLPSFFDGEPRVFSVKALPSCVELAGSPIVCSPPAGRHASLQPTMRNLDPEQTSSTLIDAVANFAAYPVPEAAVDLDAYRQSCLDALAFLYKGGEIAESKPIIFPEFTEPLISIIIPVYNQFEFTWRCLKSLAVATWGLSFEVILMDDGSTDATITLPERAPGLRYFRQEQNRHFILNCNEAARAAHGKYLYFLNNDVELTPGAVRALLQTFEDFPDAGIVGSKLVYPDGNLQEVGCLLWENGEGHSFGRHERDPTLPQYRYLRECHYTSAASLMIPRDLFAHVGGFDERYIPAYCEDSDLCLSVRAAGYKVLVQPMSVVIHYERASSPDLASDKHASKLMRQNHPKFVRKWGVVLARHPRSTDSWDLVKDVGLMRRCLFFDWRTPRIDRDAGSYAALQEMRVLQSLGVKVTFVAQDMEYAGRHTELLQRLGIECAYAPHDSTWQALLDRRGREFDFVYGMRFETMEQVIDGMRQRMPQARIVFNCADLHFLRELREAQLKKSMGDPRAADQFAKAEGIKQRELAVMRRSDGIIVYNDIEREVVQAMVPGQSAVVMPWIVPARASIPGWADRDGIAFLGSYEHPPNRDAVEFFARQVMPLVRQQIPECTFYVYGAGIETMRQSLKDLRGEGTEIVGYAPDLAAMFDRHRIFVCPMRYGAGIKGKLVMALCNGIPTVATPVSIEGMNVRDGQDIMLADTPAEFAAALCELYQRSDRWEALSEGALHFARGAFAVERARNVMHELILDIGVPI